MRWIIIFIFLSLNLQAQVELSIKNPHQEYKVGQIVPATLKILETSLINELRPNDLLNTAIENKLYFYSVEPFFKPEQSEHFSSDVRIIFSDQYKNDPQLHFKVGERKISVTITNLKFKPEKAPEAQLDWVKTNLDLDEQELSLALQIILGGLVLALVIFGGYYGYLKYKIKYCLRQQRRDFILRLEKIKTHQQLEQLWLERDKIQKKYQKAYLELKVVFEELNQLQFSPDWSQADIGTINKKLSQSITKIRSMDEL